MHDVLPPDPDFQPIHTRNYEVRAFKIDDGAMLVRGAVRDVKPAGLYIEDDPDTLTIHHMIVDLTVAFPTLVITDVTVLFETHPHPLCPTITEHYDKLVGLSIARGFTHKVRELFGGPRGCTHTTALLQAMGPVAVQSIWSMSVAKAQELGDAPRPPMDPVQRERMFAGNINTCHIWDEDGEHVAELRAGQVPPPPIPVVERMVSLGRKPEDWVKRQRG